MHLIASIDEIPAFLSEKRVEVNAIVETPQGSQNKFKYDFKSGMFRLGSVLPTGASFPFEFGFIPGTLGEDGDPLDLLLLMDSPTFAGCAVCARVVGVVEALQRAPGKKAERNDRLIAVALASRRHAHVRKLHDLRTSLLDEIEHFFISYNEMKDTDFEVIGRKGRGAARRIITKGIKLARKKSDL